MNYCLVLSTCETREEARQIASKLLEANLAACVQIDQVESLYRWQGNVESAPEWRLMIKTREGCYGKLEKLLSETHSYEVPQIVKLPIETGLQGYLDWIDDSTPN